MKIDLAKTEIIHFVGIGGIGMSGLALIMKGMGFKIQGSDISLNKNIERLKKNKIKIIIGHKRSNIDKATILVISSAIKNTNSEIILAKKEDFQYINEEICLDTSFHLLKILLLLALMGKQQLPLLFLVFFQKQN